MTTWRTDPKAIDRDQLGRTIRRLRKIAGLTQKQLGDQLGVSNVAISQLETASDIPSLPMVASLAAALNVTVAELLGVGPGQFHVRVASMQREITELFAEASAVLTKLAEASERMEKLLAETMPEEAP